MAPLNARTETALKCLHINPLQEEDADGDRDVKIKGGSDDAVSRQ